MNPARASSLARVGQQEGCVGAPPAEGFTNRPCAAAGLTSYRYKCRYGWIMIGGHDHDRALSEAARSTDDSPCIDNLQVWDGASYAPVSA
jgi:hypothetical protein